LWWKRLANFLLFVLIDSIGEQIKEEDKCQQCKGKKVIKDKKVLTVYVDKVGHNQLTETYLL
jgi:DnaJ-class molecular chaperone